MKQEAVDEGKNPIERRLSGIVARVAYMALYTVSILALLACAVSWIASYRAGYICSVYLNSLNRDGNSTVFHKRFAQYIFMRGEALFQIGQISWDHGPKVPLPAIYFDGEQLPDPSDFMLPEKGWHQFRYETYSEPPDNRGHTLGSSEAAVAFPFWSAFVVLLIPPIIWLARRASRGVLERKRGFTPILKT